MMVGEKSQTLNSISTYCKYRQVLNGGGDEFSQIAWVVAAEEGGHLVCRSTPEQRNSQPAQYLGLQDVW